MQKEIFEIHAANVDTRALLERIEERVASRGYDPAEVERVRNLSFTPVAPAREYGFDPAAVTELFERPVPAPDFRNPKFARFRGPLKWLARVLFQFFSSLHEKLNQNKVQAFYNVVHELIAVNYRMERMRDQLAALERENQLLRAGGEASDTTPEARPLPVVSANHEKLDREVVRLLLENLPEAGKELPVLVLDDATGNLAQALFESGVRDVRLNVSATGRMLQDKFSGAVRSAPDALLASQDDASLAAVMIPDLGRLSVDPAPLPAWIHRKLAPRGLVLFRVNRGSIDSPFIAGSRFDADAGALRRLCESLGFRLLQESRPEGLREGSFELLVQKLG